MELIEERPARQAMGSYDVANNPTNSIRSITGAKLLEKVENTKGEPIISASKIVDENGEPLVVYHDTNSFEYVNKETGQRWEELTWRERDEWENRDDIDQYWERRPFYIFRDTNARRSIEMPAFFFATKYDEYHEYGDRTIPVYLNIRNPKLDPEIKYAGVYDDSGEKAMQGLINEGFDGFIRTEDGEWYETNAFYPNQIKSATQNNGNFSKDDPNILHRPGVGLRSRPWI